MSVLERCLYLADLCEPGRDLEGLEEVRALARTSLDDALAAAVRHSMLHLVQRRRAIMPETLDLYNELHA
jgi:HD superfamily phosphohydrolase YqeK